MPHLVEISFKGNRKEFFRWEAEELPPLRSPVIVEADRGEDLGHVHATGELAALRARGVAHGIGDATPERKVIRFAGTEDLARWSQLRAEDEPARRQAMERVKVNGLAMKVTDAEWQWDRRKLTFYFTADRRVDFRQLVRDLAAIFRARIELKQIGVRDEARRLGGIGRCGREYCSASWLPELRPVNLGVAKDQRLSLNPSQISGACGRLMCCLRYEHDFYVQQRKRFPKEGKLLVTVRGEEKVLGNDIFRERVTLRHLESGELRVVALAELRTEVTSGGFPVDAEVEPVAVGGEGDDVVLTDDEGRPRTPQPRVARTPRPPHRPRGGQPPERTTVPRSVRPTPTEAVPPVPSALPPATDDDRAPEAPTDGNAVAGNAVAGNAATDAGPGEGIKRPRRRRGRRGGRRSGGARGAGDPAGDLPGEFSDDDGPSDDQSTE